MTLVRAVPLLLAAALAAPPARAAPEGSPWGKGYFPDVELTTHDGRKVRFYDDLLHGKLVVISLMYTRCQRECGLLTANLARVQRALGERMGRDVFFYSITLDPTHDTPGVLAAYRRAFRAGPGWTFLQPRAQDVELIRRKLGDRDPLEEHAPNLLVGNDVTGQWLQTGGIDNVKYLATVIGDWMDPGWERRREQVESYEKAPRAVADQVGDLFRRRCAACHQPGGESVGPPLDGVVARRGRAWLARYLAAPEQLRAERDPAALELASRYAVPMPNPRLSPGALAALLDWMEARSRGPAPAASAR